MNTTIRRFVHKTQRLSGQRSTHILSRPSIRPMPYLDPKTIVLNDSDLHKYTKQFTFNTTTNSYLSSLKFRKKAFSRIRKFKSIMPEKYHLEDYFVFHCLYTGKPSSSVLTRTKKVERATIQYLSLEAHHMATYLKCNELDPEMRDKYRGEVSIDLQKVHGAGMSLFKLITLEWVFEQNSNTLGKGNNHDVIDALSFNTIQPYDPKDSGFHNDKSLLTDSRQQAKFIQQFAIDIRSSGLTPKGRWYRYDEGYFNDVRLHHNYLRSILPTYIGFLLHQKGKDVAKEFIIEFLILGRLGGGNKYTHKGLKELALEKVQGAN